jgi:serine/threonine-protein kinase RsbW/sigma-B regulation protein RsbU (phosphoserine phosphatase)
MSGHFTERVAARATGLTGRDEDLLRVREMAGALVRERSLGSAMTTDLDVVLDEILSNIVRHGLRDGREHEIRVAIAIEPDAVMLTIEDDGPPFDPLSYPPPDLDADLDTRAVGGLGIHLVRRLMDDVQYERAAERNRVVLRKRRPRPGDHAA